MEATLGVVLPPLLYASLFLSHARHRPPFFKVDPFLHNSLLSLYSLFAFVSCLLHWLGNGFPTECVSTPPMPSFLIGSWYASKLWEWVDTLLLLQRRKELRRVHVLHHMFTPSLVALQFAGNGWQQTPLFEIGTALNSFVHIWMYAYFANPTSWSSRARSRITLLQVGQHLVMVALLCRSVFVPSSSRCARDVSGNVVPLLAYSFFAVEFGSLLGSKRP